MNPLKKWTGEFGMSYTDRNVLDPNLRRAAFETILNGLNFSRILEAGCNRGNNLLTLALLLPEETEITGVEPCMYAQKIAQAASPRHTVLTGTTDNLPFKDNAFDIVFTSGVLIHVPLDNLDKSLREMDRVSRRYIFSIEYYAEEETVVPYRGHDDLLWKRNFLHHYLTAIPSLRLLKQGAFDEKDGFEPVRWWLFEKSPSTS